MDQRTEQAEIIVSKIERQMDATDKAMKFAKGRFREKILMFSIRKRLLS